MIKAQELRKGSWVNAKHSGKNGINPYRILTIEDTTVKLANYLPLSEESVSDCEYGDLEPIPITHEILEKCGFKKCSCGGWKNGIHISRNDLGRLYYKGGYDCFTPPTSKPIFRFNW